MDKRYEKANTQYRVERADYYISQHLGERLDKRAICEYVWGTRPKVVSGVQHYAIVQALHRYEKHYDYDEQHVNIRRHVADRRLPGIAPIDMELVNGGAPSLRNATKNRKAWNEQEAWDELWDGCHGWRECLTDTVEEAIEGNEWRFPGSVKVIGYDGHIARPMAEKMAVN